MAARVIESSVFVPSPRKGVATHGSTYYTTLTGGNLLSLHGFESRSDTTDVAFLRYSHDNGKTWTPEEVVKTDFADPRGTGRRYPLGGYVDPVTGRYFAVWIEAVLPTDDPLEGMRQWKLHYLVSEDGGRTSLASGQIIHEGDEYNEVNHLPGISVGKNCAMIGDMGQRPLTRSDGVIIVPVQYSPAGPDGMYTNPGAGYTYTNCLILFGRWRPDGAVSWTASEKIIADPNRTTRGLIEPTIAELADGRIIMVMRGSNDNRPELPGYRWYAESSDGGQTWSKPEPWVFSDGIAFFSPSSCSQLLRHPNGRLYWIGNICEMNPEGNSPRYPIVIGEIDERSGRLERESVSIIDTRREGESPHLTLSNFYAREDRETGGIVLHMTRLFAHDFRVGGSIEWTADSMLYQIALGV
jgi:hypothetical protein